MLATLFGRNLSSSDFSSSLSYLSRKKGTSETFLSLSLFISWSRPTALASKIRLRLQKTFPQFPFFYLGTVTLEKLKSDMEKSYFRCDMEKNRNKILLYPPCTIYHVSLTDLTYLYHLKTLE